MNSLLYLLGNIFVHVQFTILDEIYTYIYSSIILVLYLVIWLILLIRIHNLVLTS